MKRRIFCFIYLCSTRCRSMFAVACFPKCAVPPFCPNLLQKNVFLTVAGEGKTGEEYRLHPLFRDFLLRRLRSEIGLAKLEAERNRIADFFFSENQWEKALPFLLEAENFEKATRNYCRKRRRMARKRRDYDA